MWQSLFPNYLQAGELLICVDYLRVWDVISAHSMFTNVISNMPKVTVEIIHLTDLAGSGLRQLLQTERNIFEFLQDFVQKLRKYGNLMLHVFVGKVLTPKLADCWTSTEYS